MSMHLQRDVEKLKKKILTLSTIVEEALYDAVRALKSKDETLAKNVIENDTKVDEMEVEVETDCLKILALHQPVATDLRYVISVLKINNDLERVGDLAANIAQRALELKYLSEVQLPFDFSEMADKVKRMLRQSLNSLIDLNIEKAKLVCAMDDEIDAMHRQLYKIIDRKVNENPELVPILLQYLSVSRYLERIADLATNIAEDVVYMVEGTIARHQPEKLQIDK